MAQRGKEIRHLLVLVVLAAGCCCQPQRWTGLPGGFCPYVSRGMLQGLDGGLFGGWMILSSTRVIKGMSGGALFDRDYRLVLGVLSGMAAVRHGPFEVPENELAGVVPCWVVRRWLAEQGVEK